MMLHFFRFTFFQYFCLVLKDTESHICQKKMVQTQDPRKRVRLLFFKASEISLK